MQYRAMPEARTDTVDWSAHELRVGQVLNEFLDRRARGEAVSEADLLAQHPDLADELRQHLGLLGDLQPAAGRIEALISRGLLSRCDDPRYPAQLGAYRISGFIGRGGMGVVLKAHEESLHRTVALKILRPELADDAGAVTRFTREARAAAALRHPNIVTVYAVGEERGVHYIAMEYVPGPSLADVIREGAGKKATRQQGNEATRVASASQWPEEATEPLGRESPPLGRESLLGPNAIRLIFRQILSGLSAAHEAGLIHRDIKSSNILLDCGLTIDDCGLNPADAACDRSSARRHTEGENESGALYSVL